MAPHDRVNEIVGQLAKYCCPQLGLGDSAYLTCTQQFHLWQHVGSLSVEAGDILRVEEAEIVITVCGSRLRAVEDQRRQALQVGEEIGYMQAKFEDAVVLLEAPKLHLPWHSIRACDPSQRDHCES